MPRPKSIIASRLSLVVFILLSSLSTLTLSSPAPSLAATALDPAKACFNPIATDNLTDNYITDDKGDPPGPEGRGSPTALKFTFIHSGPIGSKPGEAGTAELKKTMSFSADFSKLQAIFGSPTSDYLEGKYQDEKHASANLLAMKNPELIKHQGPTGKTTPTAVTNDLRQKYVNYVAEKPTPGLAESDTEFSDYNGSNKKKITELVSAYGLPNPPGPSQDRTNWINTWGKYWENIPTTYNEFYIGKLEFRPVHGLAKIEALKKGDPGSCFPNSALRTVEFPVPNFFRTAATSGVLNQVLLPKSAWSDQNDLMGIQGTVAGIKTTTSNFIKNCFKFAINNPVTNIVKKAVKISFYNLNPDKPVYALEQRATGLFTSNQSCNTSTGRVTVKFNWTRGEQGGFLVRETQWLDLSLRDDGFSSAYIATSSPPSKDASAYTTGASGGQIGPLDPGKTHYWWIYTHYLNENWHTSATDNFTTIACAVEQRATGLATSNQTCDTTTGLVSVRFSWTRGNEYGFLVRERQWLDLSLTNDNFTSSYIATSNPPNEDATTYTTGVAGGQIGPLDPGKTHYWRINTHYLNENWHTSATDNFTTIACVRDVLEQSATGLGTSNQTCDTSTGRVSIKFGWTPGEQGGLLVREDQWLDLSLVDNGFAAGTYIATSRPPSKDAISYTTGEAGGQIGPLDPGKLHFWRINTHYLNEAWHPSATDSFTTIPCQMVQWATDLATVNQVCDHTTARINIVFTWTPGKETGWLAREDQWLDLSLVDNGFATGTYLPTSRPPSKDDVSYTTGQAGGQIGQLDPDKDHYWRINTHYLNEAWHPSATAHFKTIPCKPTIDPPIITRVGNDKIVTFNFWPQGNGFFALVIAPTDGSPAVYDKIIPVGQTTMVWGPTDSPAPRWGDWKAALVYAGVGYSNEITFHIPYTLDPPTIVGRNVTFTWAPPIHINPPDGTAMAIIVTKPDGSLAWDSNGLPINSSTTTWSKAPPGDYTACLKYFIGMIGTILDGACQNFNVSFSYLWTVFDLKQDSCIKVGKAGKAGNAPFCAIYPTKFEPTVKGQANVNPGECIENSKSLFKLNNQTNVVCNLTFEWKSSDYNSDPNRSLVIPATGDGNWDSCDDPSGGIRTCYLTVGVWPDFRVPYLGQIWNNSLFSDTKEWLPTNQETGRPGVYALLTPKALFPDKEVSVNFTEADVSLAIRNCITTAPLGHTPDISNPYCQKLLDYIHQLQAASTLDLLPGYNCDNLEQIFTLLPTDPKQQEEIMRLRDCASAAFIAVSKKLPGEVSPSNLGVNTGGGNVLAANDGSQKERLIGAVDCGKHFSRDIALKPKVLQQSLGIQQDCNLTASAVPPLGGGSPSPPPPSPPPPGGCNPISDGNPANGIETGPDELMCYVTSKASGKVEKKTGLPLDQVMLGVMDRESSNGQCATAASGEIGVFQYIAATWKTVGWDGSDLDSGTYTPPAGNACWGTPGKDPVASNAPPAGSPNMFNWVANFGVNLDGDAWNPYHQIDATVTEMENSGGCPWSTFWSLYELLPQYGEKLCPAVSGSIYP